MKKLVCLMLAVVLAMGMAACGSSGGGDDSSFTWSRTGTFEDENQNYIIIVEANDAEHEGLWAVTVMLADGSVHGWFLEQKGETLAGNLNSEVDDTDTDYIVTISEEGEDGVMMEVDGGDTYHFAIVETPETVAVLKINTEGLGSFAYAREGEELEFDDEFPTQSAVENLSEPSTFVIKAKPDEDWKFVKWIKDGEDFSTDEEITVEVSEDVEYIAVFDIE